MPTRPNFQRFLVIFWQKNDQKCSGAAFFAVISDEIIWVDKTHVLRGRLPPAVFFQEKCNPQIWDMPTRPNVQRCLVIFATKDDPKCSGAGFFAVMLDETCPGSVEYPWTNLIFKNLILLHAMAWHAEKGGKTQYLKNLIFKNLIFKIPLYSNGCQRQF